MDANIFSVVFGGCPYRRVDPRCYASVQGLQGGSDRGTILDESKCVFASSPLLQIFAGSNFQRAWISVQMRVRPQYGRPLQDIYCHATCLYEKIIGQGHSCARYTHRMYRAEYIRVFQAVLSTGMNIRQYQDHFFSVMYHFV